MHSVYLLKKDDCYKIGFTRNDPKDRIKQLNTGSTSPIDLIHSYSTKYPSKLESSLHRKFKPKKVFGEWYRLDQNDIDNFLNECNKIEQIFETLKDNHHWLKELSKLKL